MIKTILVPATGTDSDATAYSDAFAVARMFGAHVDALHVAADPLEVAVNASADGGASGVLLERLIDDMKAEIDQREREAQRIFANACGGEGVQIAESAKDVSGPSAQWHVEVGQQPRWIVTYGMTADLIVAPRGKPGADADARSTLEAALLESGRPLLVPGTSRRFLAGAERVAIAWKATPQAARAVASALPFLTRAKRVTVLTVDEESARRDDVDRLLNYLAWHGMKPAVKRLAPGSADGAESLLAAAGDTADLLVMGGYGHARLREWVFGGFTQHVLEDAAFPVLIAH